MLTCLQAIGLVLGGGSLFIYGINQLCSGLKTMVGTNLDKFMEKYTNNLLMAVLTGTLVTALLNSSTAVTVISISLVRSNLMKLEQAIGITIGANIGTCVTSLMIGLKIEQLAYYFIFIGVVLIFFKPKTLMIGKVLFGFGLLFVGLELISKQLGQLINHSWFINLMLILSKQPWLALIGGTLASALIHSSALIIGIVQKLYLTGMIASNASVAFIFGSNIGTTITALMVAVGGSVPAKRAAWFHTIYNILGAVIMMFFLNPFIWLIDYLSVNGAMWIAQAHLMFNVLSTIMIFPFIKICVRLLEILIPDK